MWTNKFIYLWVERVCSLTFRYIWLCWVSVSVWVKFSLVWLSIIGSSLVGFHALMWPQHCGISKFLAKLDQTFNQISKHIVVVSNTMQQIYSRAPHGQIDVNYFLRKILLTDLISLKHFSFSGLLENNKWKYISPILRSTKSQRSKGQFVSFYFVFSFLFSSVWFGMCMKRKSAHKKSTKHNSTTKL